MVKPAINAELEGTIEEALSQLDLSAAEAQIHNDPLRLPLTALASFLRAQRQLHGDSIVSMRQAVEEGRQPVRDDDLRRAVVQGISVYAGGLVQTMSWRNVMLAAGMLVAGVAAGAGGGYWLGSSREAAKYVRVPDGLGVALNGPAAADWVALMRLNDITRTNRVCSAQAGGVACSISLWMKPPTAP